MTLAASGCDQVGLVEYPGRFPVRTVQNSNPAAQIRFFQSVSLQSAGGLHLPTMLVVEQG